jgi:hypothetical protein
MKAAFRGRELTSTPLKLPLGVYGRVLVPGAVRLPAGASASGPVGAAARRAALKRLKRLKRKQDQWDDESSEDDRDGAQQVGSTPGGSTSQQAARPELTWATARGFDTLHYW